ncbi:MAG: cysteine desulfurase family protein [Gammaproteobacteria bacterium]|nr:cysteine desulfurase family protein [Gammaproteobacteria bacterium]MCY4340639.1 cysteine desulfurase family protein [Gammaproteobacteria bacterium]
MKPISDSELVYMDYAASAPMDPRVAARMSKWLRQGPYANPASAHGPGKAAKRLVAKAARQVGALAGLSADEVVFTSGATESIGLAVTGAARYRRSEGRHVVTGLSEHPAGLNSCLALKREGFELTCLEPDRRGVISADALRSALRGDTVLVSLMHVNNEIGVVHDIAEFAAICRDHGAWLHVDAAQSAGKLPLDMQALGIDLLSLSAHKIYGPKGVGALCINRQRVPRIEPLLHGGGQQRGLRPGTLPTHQIAGLGLACELAVGAMRAEGARLRGLQDRLWSGLSASRGVLLNGAGAERAPGILSVSVEGVESNSLVNALEGVALSLGSACSRVQDEPSAVLRCIGRSPLLAASTLRFSIGRFTTEAEIDRVCELFAGAVASLRALADEAPAIAPVSGRITVGEGGRRKAGAWVRLEARWEGDAAVETAFRVFGPPILEQAARSGASALKEKGRGLCVADWSRQINRTLNPPPESRSVLLCARDALQGCLQGGDNWVAE